MKRSSTKIKVMENVIFCKKHNIKAIDKVSEKRIKMDANAVHKIHAVVCYHFD